MHLRTWKTWIVSAVVTGAFAVGAIAVTSEESGAAPSTSTTTSTSTEAGATSSVASTPVTAAAATTDALAAIETDARLSVSVLDVDTGETQSYGSGSFDTASIVKVDILAALLWQHQQAGTVMSSSELALATAMIERSDNAAATTLLEAVGGEDGLEEFNDLIGLAGTDVGSDGNWGLTQTTADDQIRLLEVALGDSTVLTPASQELVRGLMSDVVDSQRFGVSAAADDAGDAVLKVGYLQRTATGQWDVTSIGEIEAGGHTYLVAVLTDGSPTFDSGVALVDAVARAAIDQMS